MADGTYPPDDRKRRNSSLGRSQKPRKDAFGIEGRPKSRKESARQSKAALKELQLALATSEEKFTKAFNAVPVAVTVVTASDGRQIEVNDALLRMTGYTREEVIGRTFLELGYWDEPRHRQHLLDRALAGEKIRNVECRFRKKNGEPITALLSADLIDLNGQRCVVSAAMDITDLRRAQQAVRTLESRLALHFEQTMFGVVEFDPAFRITEWNPAAERIFGYTRQEVIGRDALGRIVSEDLKFELTGLKDQILHRDGRYSRNRHLRKDGQEIVCEWFNTPITAEDGKAIGIISLVHDITAQEKAQAQLAESQTILSALFESTDDMVWIVDPDNFGLTMFSAGLSRYFGQHRNIQLRVGMTPDDLLPTPSAREMWKHFYRRALGEGPFSIEYETVVGSDILDLSFYPLVGGDRIFGISVFGRNVTQPRRVQRALRESEDRYRTLVEASNDWVWEVDSEARYTYVGPQCRAILGYDPAEILGKTPFELMPVAEAQRVAAIFGETAAGRKPFRALENTTLRKDGSLVILETNGTPVFDHAGNFAGYLGTDRDITERKRSETALRESERRLRLALESGRMYAFEWDPKSDVVFRSDECANVLGDPDYPVRESGTEFFSRLLPDDRSRYLELLSQLTPAHDTYHIEYRKVLPDGRLRWIESRGRGFFDAEGKLVRVAGIDSNASERKQSDEALRKVSACLVNAQEDERKRFARELHDGISQALAVLSIEVAQAATRAVDRDLSAKLQKVYERIQHLVSDVGHLSHELHPSTLKHLGLIPAIRYLCAEISEAHGIEVEFADRYKAQAPSKDISLCLYRVAQEALQNVVKHSGSKRAWVELRDEADHIILSITDEGAGFRVRSPQSGLGLVSMRERLRLVGGKLAITSRPGSGTRVEAHVPLATDIRAAA